MNAKTKKSVKPVSKKSVAKSAKVAKARKLEPGKRVKPFQQLAIVQEDAKAREEERRIAAERIRASKKSRDDKAAIAARMMMSLSGYPTKPLTGEDLAGVRPAPKWNDKGELAKKGKKGKRNQAGTAADRKAARKAERLALREQKKALREQKKAEREEARRLKNVPALDFSPAMLKDVMNEFQSASGLKLKPRRLERLGKQAQRISTIPLRKLQNRIRNMQLKVALMEAVSVIGKAAVEDGYDKFLAPKVKKGKKGKGGFGKKAVEQEPAEKPSKAKKAAVKAIAKQVESAKAVKEPANGKSAKKAAPAQMSMDEHFVMLAEAKANGAIQKAAIDKVKADARKRLGAHAKAPAKKVSKKAAPKKAVKK